MAEGPSYYPGIEIYVDQHLYAPRRTYKRAMKKALLAAVKHWHGVYLPLHFKTAAYHRYPGVYKRRKPKRWRDKRGMRVIDNPRPLYKSGLTEMRARGSPYWGTWEGFSGTSVQARVKFSVPEYLLAIRRWGYEPLAELTVTNQQEINALAKLVDRVTGEELNKPPEYMTPIRNKGMLAVV